MKRAALLYNPLSGDGKFYQCLDNILKIYQKFEYSLDFIRLDENIDLVKRFRDISDFEHFIVAGGDGTVDLVLNSMLKAGVNIPFGILPTGTANDFAKYLGMPQNIEDGIRQILMLPPQKIDLPKVNDRYFLNVFSAGYFTDISQKTDTDLKNKIGKLAYIFKSIELLRDIKIVNVRITSEEVNFEGKVYMVIVLNGISTGNVILTNEAKANDGLLDVLVLKESTIPELMAPALGIIKGSLSESQKPSNVLYFKTGKLKIESLEPVPTDMDGEKGVDLPVTIEVIKEGLTILGIKNKM